MADNTISPYAPPSAPKSLRVIKPDPYSHVFSKWNIIRWITYFIAIVIFIWAISDPDYVSMGLKLTLDAIIVIYYFFNLYNAKKMEETLLVWEFRVKSLLKKNVIVKFDTYVEYLEDISPLRQMISVSPDILLLKFKGDKYGVAWKVYTKNYDQKKAQELEIKVKGFLDGLQERLVFQSVWYNVDDHRVKTKKVIEEAANSEIHTKPKDLHVQALMQYVALDNSPQSVVKHLYFQDLGYCKNIEKAVMQFNAIVPGLETVLKSSFHDLQRVTTPSEIIAITKEMWGEDEVKAW